MSRTIETDVRQCYSCGLSHQDVLMREYVRPKPPWTHWYQCPETGEPVDASVVVREGQAVEPDRELCERLSAARDGGGYCLALFTTRANEVTCWFVTREFPRGMLPECQRLLAKHVRDEVGGPPDEGELPHAGELPRLVPDLN